MSAPEDRAGADAVPRAPGATRRAQLPVTIITGFLGSGKTTLLNRLVRQPDMQSTAVVINEFGEVGIDHLLVETSTEMMVELNNGCICCTIRGDLADKLGSLAMWIDTGRIPRVDRVVVETTGLADPAPILHTLMVEPDLLARYRLGRLVTVVDAIGAANSLDRFAEAARQIAVADLIVVSKTDLVERHSNRAAYAELRERVRALNPRARTIEATMGEVDPALLFGERPGDDAAALLAGDGAVRDCPGCAAGDAHDHAHDHDHTDAHGSGPGHDEAMREVGISSFVVELDEPVDAGRFNAFVQSLAAEFGPRMLRMKGVFAVAGDDRPAVVHGVQHVFFPITWLERWPAGPRRSRFVFITQDLAREPVARRFDEAFGRGHA